MTSGGRSKRSKKQSASNSTPLEPPLVFFIDECLGTVKVPAALTAAGLDVKILSDVFTKGAKDRDWLAALEGKDWLVLTKDRNIRRRPLEVEAFVRAGLRVFVLTSADLTGEEASEIFVKAFPRIRRFCQKHRAPFIAGL
jgi:predicted nuclease of predicted toxin-antitoxin system